MLRFSCEKALLQGAVNTASRAVAAKSSIPALEGILLEGGDTLTLSGYNMQTGIRTGVDAQIQSPGRIVLSARLFGEMIRKMPDDVIVFDADDKLTVHLTCGDASFEIDHQDSPSYCPPQRFLWRILWLPPMCLYRPAHRIGFPMLRSITLQFAIWGSSFS